MRLSIKTNNLLAIIIFFVSVNALYGQKLNLSEILTAYNLDSISLKSFSKQRHFELKNVSEDNWIYSYTYKSTTDRNISFIRTFPKDQSNDIFLYYYFDEKKDYKNFKASLKKEGFKIIKRYRMFPNDPGYSEHRIRYQKGRLLLELSNSKEEGKFKGTLLLYNYVNIN